MSRFVRYHLPTFLWIVAMIVTTSVPSDSAPSLLPDLPLVDKLIHAFEYAGLGFLALRSLRAQGSALSKRTLLRLGVAVVLFAILDELHQIFIPGRDPSVLDFLADIAGLGLGMWVFFRVLHLKFRPLPNQAKGD